MRVGVLGVGRAGRARVQALRRREEVHLVGAYRGRFMKELGVRSFGSVAELCAAVDLVFVCSPDAHHPTQVRQALQAGCHVVCEFPLAPTGATATELYNLAATQGRLLHAEHIETLSVTSAAVAHGLAGRRLRKIRLEAARVGKLPADPTERAHALAVGHLARFHRLWMLAGPMQPIVAEVRGDTLLVDAVGRDDAPIRAVLRTSPDAERGLFLDAVCEDGARFVVKGRQVWCDGRPTKARNGVSLFDLDTALALAALRHPVPAPASGRELAVARLVEQVVAACVAGAERPCRDGP